MTRKFVEEQVRQARALRKDAIEHGDRKGRWHAEGQLDMAMKIMEEFTGDRYV